MRVALSTLFLLLVGNVSLAQVKPIQDTAQKQDTSIIHIIKSDIQDNMPTISLNEEDLDEGSSMTVSSILTAGRDPFLSSAEYNFSVMRFRLRGYENFGNSIYLNGVDFSGLENGFTPFGLWSGLNNVMRARETSYGLEANNFSLGSLALNTNIDMRAGAQWAQTQIGYAFSNRNYTHRITFNHGSGFNKKGWAYSLAVTPRYTNEMQIPGVYYRGMSYYAAVDKKFSEKSILSFITFGAPTEMARAAATVQETRDLVGDNLYNPSWGYQNGKIRSANVLTTFQPAFMMVYEYKPNNRSNWMTTAGYLFGKRKTSALDWYNAPDPRPDYYRYLPSYTAVENPAQAEILKNKIIADPTLLQINWNRLYEVNRSNTITVNNADGIAGNSVTGRRSLYILSDRVVDQKRIYANSVYNTTMKKMSLTAGVNFHHQINHYYQEVKDLLGGEFWVNLNQFAERDFPDNSSANQHDLNNPNRLVKNGEQYGYNYKMTMTRGAGWAQGLWKLDQFDFFAGAELSATSFHRNGLNRNGLFPNESFGKSEILNFINVAAKAGATYKMDGRNYFFVNAAYQDNAPFFENVYISQRTRNATVKNPESESVTAFDAGYRYFAPGIKMNIRGYYTQSKNGYDVMTFYHDQYQNFVNYSLSNIDKVYFGGELGVEAKLTNTLTLNGAAAIGRYYYDSRQHAVVTVDNSAEVLAEQTVYLKNFRIPSTPQNAYSMGLNYRSPKYWFVSLTGNYFSNMWLSVNPLRRTAEALGDVDPTQDAVSEEIAKVLAQEKYDDQFTLDFFGGWNKRLPKKYNIGNRPTSLVFNVSVGNILNDKAIRTGGFEQLRFDSETRNIDKFPPKYYYGLGINYSISVALRF